MSDLSSRSALVVDTGGMNVETAIRLAKDFGKVYYSTNFHRGFDRLTEGACGMGFENIEWVDDEFGCQPDLWVFPDCSHHGLQTFLESRGERVFGSRNASMLEHKRAFFLRTVKQLGLKVPDFQVVIGVTELKAYLSDHPDTYVKCSHWRGSCETFHHINMEMSQPRFAALERELGGMIEHVPFVVVEPVDAVVENGYDGLCIDGQFPKLCLQGIETKDKAYIGAVTDYDKLPEDVLAVNEAFADTLREYRYRNRWSTEVRVTDDGSFYFLDPTCRIPSPAGESQLANELNTGEIYWEGAVGNLVEPEYRSKFAVQVVIEHDLKMCEWRPVEVPGAIKDSVFLKYPCKVDGLHWIPPQYDDAIVGWVVGLGDTIKEAIDSAKDTAEELSGQNLKIDVSKLSESLKAVEEQEKQGMEFTDQPVPKPSIVAN